MTDAKQTEKTYGQWWESSEEQVTVRLSAVENVGMAALREAGASEEDAAFLLSMAVAKALQGDYVRGLGSIRRHVTAAQNGSVDMNPTIEHLADKGAMALVDGGPKAQDALVCRYAIDLACDKAREFGVGWVSARSSGGSLAPFMKRAAARDMAAMVFIQARFPVVAPTGGSSPMLGNAPVGFAIPAGRHDPVIVDMSITQTSASPVADAARQGKPVASDMILDASGQPTTDTSNFLKPDYQGPLFVPQGSILPLGGARSGHKGYALVFFVGLLSYLMTDTTPPWDLALDSDKDGQPGTMFLAMDPSNIMPIDRFKEQVDEFIDHITSSPRKEGVDQILYPGQRSQLLQRQGRERDSVTMPASQYHDLSALAKELGMDGVL